MHEAGHQFWYAIVGNNEFEHAWLDEGLNTFSEQRVQAIAFRPDYRLERFFGGFLPWQFRDIPLRRETDGNLLPQYRGAAEWDVPATPSLRYWPGTHAWITLRQDGPVAAIRSSAISVGTPSSASCRTFFERWKFRHPRPEDFFAVVNEVSGRDMTWFFDQVHRSSNVFDYGVERLDHERRRAHEAARRRRDENAKETENIRTTVVVRRLGEAIFPVDVLVTFENGDQIREKHGTASIAGRRSRTSVRPAPRTRASGSRAGAAPRCELHE